MARNSDLPRLSRRELFKLAAAGVVGYSASGWLEAMANDVANNPQRRRSCILLWMNGGPSQMDTFDLKPGGVRPRLPRPAIRSAARRRYGQPRLPAGQPERLRTVPPRRRSATAG